MSQTTHVNYLIIGGGAAAANAAVGIREIDSEGSVLIVGKETWWPYDRPPLSKGMLRGEVEPADAESKDPSWYEKNRVEVLRGVEATDLDLALRRVELRNSPAVSYEKLLIATGSSPKALGIKGEDLNGVHRFRTIEDSLAVKQAFASARAVLFVGSSYIGVEVASAALDRELKVTLIDPNSYPLPKALSPSSGEFLKGYLEKQGVEVVTEDEVIELLGENQVEGAVTKGGRRLECDLAVVGVGVEQNLDLAKSAGLLIDKDGVVVDAQLRTQDPNVWVAGDIASFDDRVVGKRWHAEHFMNARWQGKQAGRNMAGAGEAYAKVPYFFSDFLDLHLVLRGDPNGGEPAIVLGDLYGGEFIELWERDDGTLSLGVAVSRDEKKLDPISDKLEELFKSRAIVAELDDTTFGQ